MDDGLTRDVCIISIDINFKKPKTEQIYIDIVISLALSMQQKLLNEVDKTNYPVPLDSTVFSPFFADGP